VQASLGLLKNPAPGFLEETATLAAEAQWCRWVQHAVPVRLLFDLQGGCEQARYCKTCTMLHDLNNNGSSLHALLNEGASGTQQLLLTAGLTTPPPPPPASSSSRLPLPFFRDPAVCPQGAGLPRVSRRLEGLVAAGCPCKAPHGDAAPPLTPLLGGFGVSYGVSRGASYDASPAITDASDRADQGGICSCCADCA
jgi:hypothetical protein